MHCSTSVSLRVISDGDDPVHGYRGDTRAIVGYDDQSVINNLISQYDEDKEEFTLLWEGVDLRLYSLIPQQQRRHRLQARNYRHRLQR